MTGLKWEEWKPTDGTSGAPSQSNGPCWTTRIPTWYWILGPTAKKVVFPNWAVFSETGTRKMPTVLKANSILRIQLEIVGEGGDANTFARWTLYHKPPQQSR